MFSCYRCLNGGTCIDGVDNFTCSCPSDLTGLFCECLIIDSNTTDCGYVRPTINILQTTVFNKTIPTSATKRTPDLHEETTYETSSTFYETSVPERSTESTYLESTTSSSYTETEVPKETSVTTQFDLTSGKFLPTDILGSTPYGIYTSIFYGSETSMISSISDTTTNMFETLPTLFDTTAETTTSIDTTFEDATLANVTKTTESSPVTSIREEITFFTTPSSAEPTDLQTEIEEITTSPTVEQISSLTDLTTESMGKTPKSINWTDITTASKEESTEASSSETTIYVEMSSEDTIYSTTLSDTTMDVEIVTALPIPDCTVTPCKNGGTCIVTIEGSKVSRRYFVLTN